MSATRRNLFFVGLLVGAAASFLLITRVDADTRAIAACVDAHEGPELIDCLYALIDERMAEESITESMRLFQRVYEGSTHFARTGCHTHAHRVGDMAYYNIFVPTRDLAALDLGVETGACGYGFYHGLFEHLVQDNLEPEYVMNLCEVMAVRLQPVLGDIRKICYHGSGHGFMLGHVEDLPQEVWGDIHAFVDVPLSLCARLDRATQREREECEEGIYNVIVEWMETTQFGFRYDDDAPFAVCEEAQPSHRRACYYEMAQKLDRLASGSVLTLHRILEQVSDDELRRMSFSVAIAGMVQPVAYGDGYQPLFSECFLLQTPYKEICVDAIIHGLFEHGLPTEEYRKPLSLCADSRVAKHGLVEGCYAAVARRLPRFYEPERRVHICAEMPVDYREGCLAAR